MTPTESDYQLPTLGRLARRTIATVLGALHNRAELFTVEFEEENNRLLKVVVFGVGALFLLEMAVLLLTGTIIFLVPEQYRVYAAAGFGILYLVGAVAAVMTIKKLTKTPPFAESMKQLKKDAELLDALK
jgi:uncharacterized membrane protein YqjE